MAHNLITDSACIDSTHSIQHTRSRRAGTFVIERTTMKLLSGVARIGCFRQSLQCSILHSLH